MSIKKWFSVHFFTLALVMSLVAMSIPTYGAEGQNGNVLIDFEDYELGDLAGQGNWTHTSRATIDSTVTHSGTKSLKIVDPDATVSSGARFAFDPIVRGTVEFWTLAENEDRMVFILEDDSANRTENLGFYEGGVFEYSNPKRTLTDYQYKLGQWYKIAIHFDMEKKTKQIVISDGETIFVDEDTVIATESAETVSLFRIATFIASAGTYYIDDIKITDHDAPVTEVEPKPETPQPTPEPTDSSAGSFSDVASHWAKEDIEQLAGKEIVLGLSDGRFAPDQAITRADFTAYLVRGLGLTEDSSAISFSDVPSSHTFAGAIGAAVKAELIQGMGDNQFMPEETITREQMAVIFARALKLQGKEVDVKDVNNALAKFADQQKISGWAQEEVAKIVEAKVIQGNNNNEFSPQNEATRAEATVMLKRFLSYVGIL